MSETPETPMADETPSTESRREPPTGEGAKPRKSSARRKSTAQEAKAAETKEALTEPVGGEPEQAGTSATAGAAVARAEQKVDQWGYEIGRWASRMVARAREEAEDIVAEAQHLRKNGRS